LELILLKNFQVEDFDERNQKDGVAIISFWSSPLLSALYTHPCFNLLHQQINCKLTYNY